MKAKSCWDDQETHAVQAAWVLGDGGSEPMAEPGSDPALAWTPEGAVTLVTSATSMTSERSEAAGAPGSGLRRRSSDSLFQSLMRLWPREGRRPEASAQTMARLRAAFRGCLTDLIQEARERSDVRAQLRLEAVFGHIVHSGHPEDLWHLRASLYTEVARARGQAEAERRVALLTQQFELSRGRLKLWTGRG